MALIGEGEGLMWVTHDVMNFWASWYSAVVDEGTDDEEGSLASDTESSTSARVPSPVEEPARFAGLFPAGLIIRDGRASGDDVAAAP